MSKKSYVPKKPKYNDLATLAREMIDERVRMVYDGVSIRTKHQIFSLYDGQIQVRENND
jgi:hypothetical protein